MWWKFLLFSCAKTKVWALESFFVLEQNSFSFFFEEKHNWGQKQQRFSEILFTWKKLFFFFFLVIFSNFFFNRKKIMFGKTVQNIQKESFYVVFLPLSKLSHRFVSGNRVLFPHFNRGKTCFSRKIPKKSSTHKTFVSHLVSRNIFHLKHFFLDFYFCFFVFFSSVKNFLPCGTKWRNSFLSTRFHPEYKENTISGENV